MLTLRDSISSAFNAYLIALYITIKTLLKNQTCPWYQSVPLNG